MENHKIVFGDYVFFSRDISSASYTREKSLLNSALSMDTFTATVAHDSPQILEFDQYTKLTYFSGGVQKGIYYLQSVERTGINQYKLSAVSSILFLASTKHPGGIYTGQTVNEIVKEICGSLPVYVKTSLADIKLYGWLPYADARDNLRQVLYATGASLGTDLDGVLRVESLWDGVSNVINPSRMFVGGNIKRETPVTAVSILEHQYIEGTEEAKLFDGTVQQGDIIIFNEPMHSLSATGITILESGANYARVSAGNGSLTGKKYIHNTRLVTKPVSEAEQPNIKAEENATLVSLVNSNAVLDRRVAFYQCQETITNPIISTDERPGDIMMVYHPYNAEMVKACIQRAEATESSFTKATEKLLVGFVPPNTAGVYDTVEVITEDTAWQEPEGATTARIVLIGGSAGGASGTGGKPGTINNSGGEGGIGGAAGSGGKIYEFSIDLAGKTHNIKIGLGGAGGIYAESGSNPGSPGTATTFDAYTSDMGTASETGYLDPINQTTYATPGKAGVNGGKGGKGGKSTSSDSEAGESVGEYSGGRPGSWQRIATDTGYAYAHGAGGGGAAMGANGGRGGSGYINSTASGMGGDGGTGASATIVPDKPKTRGGGGDGGHAGGGGGSPGIATGFSQHNYNGFGGPGGSGNNGGPGADGVALIFYARTKPIAEGALATADNKWFVDKHGRRFIV